MGVTTERPRRKRLPGPVRGPKALPPEMCRPIQRKFQWTPAYSAWVDAKAEALNVDRQIVVDMALRVLAGLMRWDAPPVFDPRLVPEGPLLPGLDGLIPETPDSPAS